MLSSTNYNMRIHFEFGDWLLNLGNGRLPARDLPPFEGCIRIPDGCVRYSIVNSIIGDELVNHAIGDQIILCPTNKETLKSILDLLPGQQRSLDDIVSDDEHSQYPIVFLNNITPSGMAPHRL